MKEMQLRERARGFASWCSGAAEAVVGKAKAIAAAVIAAPVALAVSGQAHAGGGGDTLASAALAAVGGLEADVRSILVVLIGVVFLIVLFMYLKKAK